MQKKDFLQKRQYIRLNSIFPVEIFIPFLKDKRKHRLIQAFTCDVSLGGLCLRVNDPDSELISLITDQKTSFDIHVNMPITYRPIEAKVCVVWHEVKEHHRHKQLNMGVFYEAISQKDKKAIVGAARRMKWFPRAASISIIILLCLLGVSYYHTRMVIAKNRSLIERFYGIQEVSDIYRQSFDKIDRRYSSFTEELGEKENLIRQLNTRLDQAEAVTIEMTPDERESLQEELSTAERDKGLLEEKIKNVLERKEKADKLLRETQQERKKLEDATLKNMNQWFSTHQNKVSGLIMSFEGDPSIKNWGFTYDQSLACQVFMLSGNFERASKILSFYNRRAKKIKGGYANAYNVTSGNSAEYIVNVGPNVWIGIAALQYTEEARDKRFLSMAENIAKWLISQKDSEGGLKGGPDINWYSTEHNLDAYAFFNMLYDITGKDIYKENRDQTLKWIKDNTYSAKTGGMKRGKGDATIATDTLAWAIAAVGPAMLFKEGMNPEGIMKFAEENCLVKTNFMRPDGTIVSVSG
ncbi:MAG: PilZ domain-containing protein, partial [Candidatus Omnitrophica bacterium]|nr:PilZ domain-containing protein [Candidatus Omnitrophota bacterium]